VESKVQEYDQAWLRHIGQRGYFGLIRAICYIVPRWIYQTSGI